MQEGGRSGTIAYNEHYLVDVHWGVERGLYLLAL